MANITGEGETDMSFPGGCRQNTAYYYQNAFAGPGHYDAVVLPDDAWPALYPVQS